VAAHGTASTHDELGKCNHRVRRCAAAGTRSTGGVCEVQEQGAPRGLIAECVQDSMIHVRQRRGSQVSHVLSFPLSIQIGRMTFRLCPTPATRAIRLGNTIILSDNNLRSSRLISVRSEVQLFPGPFQKTFPRRDLPSARGFVFSSTGGPCCNSRRPSQPRGASRVAQPANRVCFKTPLRPA
jgi:hypothetical protein